MYISIYHLGHILASDLNNLKGTETLLLLYIMGTVINFAHENDLVIKSRVMRLSHGIKLISLNALDPVNKSDHQLESHHLLISK